MTLGVDDVYVQRVLGARRRVRLQTAPLRPLQLFAHEKPIHALRALHPVVAAAAGRLAGLVRVDGDRRR